MNKGPGRSATRGKESLNVNILSWISNFYSVQSPERGSAFFVILIFVKPAVMAGFIVYDRVVNGVFYAGCCFN